MPSPKAVVFPKKVFVTLKERHENDLYNKKSESAGDRKKRKEWIAELDQILKDKADKDEKHKWKIFIITAVILVTIMIYVS